MKEFSSAEFVLCSNEDGSNALDSFVLIVPVASARGRFAANFNRILTL